jgi:hypothetical protein
MPRDLTDLAKHDAISNMSPLDRTSKPDTDSQPDNKPRQGTMFAEQAQKNSKRDDLHPYTQTLTLNDVESCVILEEAAFPPQERATREKVSQPFLFLSIMIHLSLQMSCHILPHCDIFHVSRSCCMRWLLPPSAVLA